MNQQTETRIREAELALEAKIAEMKTGLIRCIIGAGVLQTVVIIGVLLLVVRLV